MEEPATFRQWQRFVQGLPLESPVREVVLESWGRSRLYGVPPKPATLTFRRIPEAEFLARLHANTELIEVATQHLQWISGYLTPIQHVAYLVDRDGIVLYSTGNAPDLMHGFGLLPGYDRSEATMGTNGAGTALAANKPVAVIGPEHFCRRFHDCACTAALIHAPDGGILGAIDVSTNAADGDPARLKIVSHLAFVIEQEIALVRRNQAIVRRLTEKNAALERKWLDQEIRDQLALLKAVAEGTNDAIFVKDCSSRYKFINTAGARFHGMSVQDIIGKSNSELFDSATAHKITENDKRVFSTGELLACDETIVSSAGEPRIYSTVKYPFTDGQGHVLGLIGIARDITERKRAENTLQVKTAQLEAVSQAMAAFFESGDWRKTSGLLLRSALDLTESQYGFIGVVVEGPALRILVHEGITWDSTVNREFYEKALRTYQELGYLEFTNFENLFGKVITTGEPVIANDPARDPRAGGLPPGHPPLNSFLGIPILRGTETVGETVGMIGVANRAGGYTWQELDRLQILCQAAGVLYDSYRRREQEAVLETRRKQTEQALRDSERKFRQALQDRARLARDLHDDTIQNIYAAGLRLEQCLELLGNKKKASKALEEVIAGLNGIIQGLRGYLSKGAPPALSASQIMEEWDRLARSVTGQQIPRFRILVDPKAVALLSAEEAYEVLCIAREAMSNSLRHSKAKRGVLSLQVKGKGLRLEVKDDGVGFDVQACARRGRGLRNIAARAEALGGRLTVVSNPGQGTRFTVDLPRKPHHARAKE